MLLIGDITEDAYQEHTIVFAESEIALNLTFAEPVQRWFADISYKGKSANGIALATGTLHVVSRGWPFDFLVIDNSAKGLDPFQLQDFAQRRTDLYVLEPADMEEVRGGKVAL